MSTAKQNLVEKSVRRPSARMGKGSTRQPFDRRFGCFHESSTAGADNPQSVNRGYDLERLAIVIGAFERAACWQFREPRLNPASRLPTNINYSHRLYNKGEKKGGLEPE